jgi:hypothetical protein
MSNYRITREELNMPEGEVAFVELNGTDDNGQDYWQIYHRIEGVAIWGTVIPVNSRAEAVARLEQAIEDGEARKVVGRVVYAVS